MVTTGQCKHRPGTLKQSNKAHKTGRHRSKGSISNAAKGKIDGRTLPKHVRKEMSKDARRHQNQQIRKKKRDEAIALKRNLAGSSAPPILIAVIPLHEDVDVKSIISLITGADDAAPCVHVSLPRFKQRYTFIAPPVGDIFATLDAAKVSTTLLFAVSAVDTSGQLLNHDMIDGWGETIISACIAQGLPSTITAITNLESLPVKKRQDVKQKAQDLITKWLPEEKILTIDKPTDALNLLRKAGSQKQTNVAYRSKRPHLLAENVEYSSEDRTLFVSGYLRGLPISVNGLVHIPGFGDFQMSQIDAPEDPHPIDAERGDKNEGTLEQADPTIQESLESENIPDAMDTEQTWPTDEEIAQANENTLQKKVVKRVPKGTSEYQAAWIPDEVGEIYEDSESCSGEDDNDGMSVSNEDDSIHEDVEDDQEQLSTFDGTADEHQYDEEMDHAEEIQTMEKLKEAKLDAQFPDEIDTPTDTLAKLRFQKYRGLESFRTSLWDPKENLPADYGRIFQFENFERTRKRIFNGHKNVEGVMPGRYITLHIKDVSSELYDAYLATGERPLIVFGLLPNEQKMSLLNVSLKRINNTNAEPIKSKDRLIFQCGFRRFSACPIFSQHTNGSKHKYARFFQPEDTAIASMYAPITFSPCPVLCYRTLEDGALDLVATGSVFSVDPDRLVIKRVILSGHPFKVHKRSAVIRFMFFNREDIMWFKPVQLHTKYGRRGHIREPLGTHGHMKCVFDGQLKSQDTILMSLYKRIFPKWTYKPCLLTSEKEMNN